MVIATVTETEQPRAGWRLRLGLIILVVGFLSPLTIPLVSATELPAKWKAVISGALAIGIPEVFSIVAIAIMGKAGFTYIKARIFGFLKKHGPPDRVSRTRYHIGLAMFALPILFGWLGPYGAHLIPGYETHRFVVGLIGDVMLVASLFVLGGDFWDKIRALFIHQARVQVAAEKSN
jgi:small basic protein